MKRACFYTKNNLHDSKKSNLPVREEEGLLVLPTIKKSMLKKWNYILAFCLVMMFSSSLFAITLQVTGIIESPYTDANGIYISQGIFARSGVEYWKHESKEYYIYYDEFGTDDLYYYWNLDVNKDDEDTNPTYGVIASSTEDPLTSPPLSLTWNKASEDFNEPFSITIAEYSTIPEINLLGNGVTIVSGDNTPSFADYTKFASTDVSGGTSTRTYTIQNTGTVDALTIGAFTIGGANADDFTVTTSPASTVSQSSSTTFIITFNPSATGERTATVSFVNNDSNENPYTFTISGYGYTSKNLVVSGITSPAAANGTYTHQGVSGDFQYWKHSTLNYYLYYLLSTRKWYISYNTTTGDSWLYDSYSELYSPTGLTYVPSSGITGPVAVNEEVAVPEINIKVGAYSISDGTATTQYYNNTNFGSVEVASGDRAKSFTIENTGNATLTLSGASPYFTITGTNASDFSVSTTPSNSISASGTTTFGITFNPSAAGTRTATVTVLSNDADEAEYTFAIQGEGVTPRNLIVSNITAPTAANGTYIYQGILNEFQYWKHSTQNYYIYNAKKDGIYPKWYFDVDLSVDFYTPSTYNFISESEVVSPVSVPSWTSSSGNSGTPTIQYTEPEINVTGNAINIISGDATPSLFDYTDLGWVVSGSIAKTFTIQNTGIASLNLTGTSPYITFSGADASQFSITSIPSATIAPAGSTTFEVTFTPSSGTLGARTAILSILNDDTNENPYTFTVQSGVGTLPVVTTQAVSSIGTTTATGNGNVTTLGSPNPTSYGICYGTSPNPDVTGSKVDLGTASATGAFTASIAGLTIATTYHVRTFATNNVGTVYGDDETFTTSSAPPTVTTTTATLVGSTSATLGGEVTADGGATVTERGVVYSTTNTTPTIGGADVTQDANATTGTGSFSESISGLTTGTTYYVCAYATNAEGTNYGSVVSFSTTPAGTGTSGDPYLISNLAELKWISDQTHSGNTFSGKYFKQTADIDASSTSTWFPNGSGGYYGWFPIGYYIDGSDFADFLGNYDGFGHSISNLYINRPSIGYVGLFGVFGTGTIQNLGVIDVSITANGSIGGLCGYVYLNANIANCFTTGAINCIVDNAGGLIGAYEANTGGSVNNCFSGCNVSCSNTYTGGLIGETYNSTSAAVISNCYSFGSVSGGGLIGLNASVTVNNCFWDTETSGKSTSAGGTGKTTAQMQTKSTFTTATWDFRGDASGSDDWDINSIRNGGYPFLSYEHPVAPEINIQGNSVSISDGDATPSTTDDTDFGSLSVASSPIVKTFTIQNVGSDVLNLGATAVTKTGDGDFTITDQPDATVAAGSSTTFEVTFDATTAGDRSAEISIANDDSDENPYTYSVQGTGIAPEINVQGGTSPTTIADGNTVISTTDDTDFGSQLATSGTITKTFTIQNTGNATLNLGTVSLSGSGDFAVTQPLTSTVAAGSSTTFTVEFDPSATGILDATVSIPSDDSDEATYTFAIQGTGIPAITVDNVSVFEDEGPAVFTISLSHTYTSNLTVDYTTSTNSAYTSDADYTHTVGTATIIAGQPSTTVSVPIIDDTHYEPDELYYFHISNPSFGTITTTPVGRVVGTIKNDDTQPSVTLSLTGSPLAENGGVATVKTTLSNRSFQNVTVNLGYTGTAEASDYTAAGSIVVSAGTMSNTTTITGVNEAIDEDDETVIVDITTVSNGSKDITSQQVTATIADDDDPPTVSVNDPSVTEGDAGSATLTFAVTLSVASERTITVDYSTSDGTAVAGTDYTSIAATTLTFNPGETSKNVSVTILGDLTDENNETVNLNLTNLVNVAIGDAQGVGTITDNDAEASLSIDDVTLTEGNSGSTNATFTVTLTPASGKTVTVNYTTANNVAISGNDYTTVANTLTFNPGITSQTITVPVLGDVLDETDETFYVNLSSEVNATISDAQGVGTITDDDLPPTVTLSVSPAAITEEGGVSTITATLSNASGKAISITLGAIASSTASSPADYSFSTQTITINPSDTYGTVTVTAVGNSVAIGHKTVIVGIAGTPVNATEDGIQQQTITILDDDVATVSSVSSSTADGSYKAGDVIVVTITFTHPVTVTGTPQLTLETGTTDETIGYSGGSGTTTLTFSYTVQAGDESADLDYVDVNSLSANGGTITNSGLDAILTLPTPGAVGSLSANMAIVIDNTPPTATIGLSDYALKAGETATVTITFTEKVTGFANSDLTISNGTLTPVASTDGGITFTGTFTPNADVEDATNIISLNNTLVADLAGNAGTGTTSSSNFAIDTKRPTVTVVLDDSALKVGETATVTITFSEEVTGFDNSGLTFSNGTLTTMATVDDIIFTGIFTPTVDFEDATNIISLDNTLVADLAGNAGTGATSSSNFTIDTKRPTATVVLDDSALKVGETATVTITFSEEVTGFDNSGLTFSNGTLTTMVTVDDIIFKGTFTPTADFEDATNIISLDNTLVADLAGNAGTGTTSSSNFAIDTKRPTVTVVLDDSALKVGETAIVTITFSEAATGFDNTDIIMSNGTLTPVASTDGDITFTGTFTPTADFEDPTNIITLDNTLVADLAGNAGTGATSSSNFAIDTKRPTATVALGDYALKVGETATVTITFSEAVTGFDNTDLVIPNGTLTPVSSSDGNITFTGTFTPNADFEDATNIISLDNTLVADLAGNAGTGTTSSSNFAIDTKRPTATIALSDYALKASETATVTITFSEAVTGLTNADLNFSNGTLTPVSSSDGGITWVSTFTPTVGIEDATNIISLDNTLVADLAGNAGTGTTSSSNFAIDTKIPVVANVTSAKIDGTYGIGETILISVEFDQTVTVTGTPQLGLETGVVDRTIDYLSGNNTSTLVFSYITGAGDESADLDYNATSSLTLNGGTIADATGNNAILTLPASGVAGSLGANKALVIQAFPLVTLGVGNTSVDENGGTTSITATLSQISTQDVVVSVSYSGSAANGTDYNNTASTSITVPAGSSSASAAVGIIATTDDIVETNETIIIDITSISKGFENGAQQQTVTITDDDQSIISIGATTQAAEDATNGVFTISVDKELSTDLTVDLTLSGTAANGLDMNTMATSVLIPAGSFSVTTPVTLINDAIAEGNETVILTLGTNSGAPTGATVSNSTADNEATVTITDNDLAVVVSIAATTQAAEDATNGLFTISVDKKLSTALTVSLVPSGTATDGVDMSTLATSVVIPAGDFSVTTPVSVISDNLVEGDETVIYILGTRGGAPTGVAVTNSLTADKDTVTITDDDLATLRVTRKVDAYENVSNGAFYVITDKRFDSNVNVGVFVGGTATAGTDYTAIVSPQLFLANTDTLTLTVAQLDDSESEINEYVILNLVSTNNARVSIAPAPDSTATVTIFDDDQPLVVLSQSVSSFSEAEGKNAITATLNKVHHTNVVVTLAATGTSTPGSDFSSVATITVPAGSLSATDTLRAIQDQLVEVDETVVIDILSITNGVENGTQQVSSTIIDDDEAVLSISSAKNGKEGSSSAVFHVVTDKQIDSDVTVNIAMSGTATEGVDYATLGGVITFPAYTDTFDVSVLITDDIDTEDAESVIMALVSTSNADVTIAPAPNQKDTVTIIDDDIRQLVIANTVLTTSKMYDGNDTAKVIAGTLTNLIPGDNIVLKTEAHYDNATAGNKKKITIHYTVTGEDSIKYFAPVDSVYLKGLIEQGNLNIHAEDKTLRYGDSIPELTLRYEFFDTVGHVSDLDHQITAWVNTDSITGPGTYPIHISGGKDDNYALFYFEGTLTIEKALLKVTAHDKSITYGETLPELTYTIEGFLEGDNDSVLSSLPTIAATTGAGENAGVFEIIPSGGSDDFYEFDYQNGKLMVAKAMLTATASDRVSSVGTIPSLTVGYKGFVKGDTSSELDTLPVATTTATKNSPSGEYPISVSGGYDNNYNFTYVGGELTLASKANPTITWNTPSDMVYGELLGDKQLNATCNAYGTLVYEPAAGTLLGAGEMRELKVTFIPKDTINVNKASATVHIDVERATITVTANNKTITYGEILPVLSFSYSAFMNGENASVLDKRPSASTIVGVTDAGTYPIVLFGGEDDNYKFEYINGELTIEKAKLTVDVADCEMFEGDALPVFALSYSGFITGESVAVLDTLPKATTQVTTSSAPGIYEIIAAGGKDNNYSFVYEKGNLTVKAKQHPVVTWANPSDITYGTALGATQLNAKANVAGTFTYTPSTGAVLAAGKSQLLIARFTPTDIANYVVVTDTALINVSKAPLTVTADNAEMKAGETVPEFTLIYNGFVNGDDKLDIDKQPVATSTASSTSEKGEYAISVSGGEDNNYSFIYVSGTLTIKSGNAVKEIDAMSLLVYPNPFTDQVSITADYKGVGSYQLSDITGKVIEQGNIANGTGNLKLSHIRKGVYLLQVKMGEGCKTFRLIKQ